MTHPGGSPHPAVFAPSLVGVESRVSGLPGGAGRRESKATGEIVLPPTVTGLQPWACPSAYFRVGYGPEDIAAKARVTRPAVP